MAIGFMIKVDYILEKNKEKEDKNINLDKQNSRMRNIH
jgi:hypothetical protein